MRSAKYILISMVLTIAMASIALADDGAKKAMTNKRCPVMNADAKENIRTEYKGQFVYFCCQGCVAMFEKDAEGYIAKLSKEDQEAIKANEVCPITNEKITERTRWVEHEGRKVYFCCDGCAETFKSKIAEKKVS